MIILKELKIKDFISHEKTDIKFDENSKILVDGKSGSGKSSITEAILWVLYGKGRSDNRSLVRRGSKTATVSLKLNDGPKETIITRSVSSTGKNTLSITQNTGSEGQFLPINRTGAKETQEWIESDFLRASYELFTNSIAYPQDNENSFVKASASKRKDLLLEIVRAGNFDELYTKARNLITLNEKENAVTSYKIEELTQKIAETKDIVDKIDIYKDETKDLTVKIDKKVNEEEFLTKKLNDISSIQQKINDKKALITSYIESLEKIENQEKKDGETLEEHKKLDIDSAKGDLEKSVVLQQQINEMETLLRENATNTMKMNALLADKPNVVDFTKDIENINKQIIPLLKDSDSCPAGDKCPFILPIKSHIEFLSGQIKEKNEITKNQKEALTFWEKRYTELVPLRDDSNIYEGIKKNKEEIVELEKSRDILTRNAVFKETLKEIDARKIVNKEEIFKLNNYLVSMNKDIEEFKTDLVEYNPDKLNLDISTLRMEIKGLRDSYISASGMLLMAQNGVKTLKKCKDDISDLKAVLSVKNEENESLSLLKEAFGSKGIKSVIVDYIIPQLEDRINKVLSQMSDFSIRLDTQKDRADGEGIKEGLFITVLNETGEEMSFDNYSGGEKNRIIIAISEGLSSLTSNFGFRLMDEMIVGLNSEMVSDFIEVLIKLQKKYPQILFISHIPECKEVFENIITVIKKNGISTIKK